MAILKWTPQALADVEANADFIAKDSVYYAQIFARKVFKTVDKLTTFPMLGRIVPEINSENIREIILGNFRIIYRVDEDVIEILTVYHSARLLEIDNRLTNED